MSRAKKVLSVAVVPNKTHFILPKPTISMGSGTREKKTVAKKKQQHTSGTKPKARPVAKPARKERRAFAQSAQEQPLVLRGDSAYAQALGRALDQSADDGQSAERVHKTLTHGAHTYPARVHPFTARGIVRAMTLNVGQVLLDPFCGSGTVLVEGIHTGLSCIGVDVSPLAIEISRAKTWAATAGQRKGALACAEAIRDDVVASGKAARSRTASRAPAQANLERDAVLRGWYDPHVRRELEALLTRVNAEPDEDRRAVLRVVLSSLLIKFSRRESDTSAKKIEKTIGRGNAARHFARRAEELLRGLNAFSAKRGSATVHNVDARHLLRANLTDESVDGIVTSPPYAGTYNYAEQQELRHAFLQLPIDSFKKREIGARDAFRGGKAGVALTRWQRNYGDCLKEMMRVLRPGGRVALLIGDSLAGPKPVFADDVTSRLAKAAGFRFVASASQRRQPLGSDEMRAFAERDKQEHLLLFVKPAN